MIRETTAELVSSFVKAEYETSSIYRKLSKASKDASLSNKLEESSKIEEQHALYWAEFLRKRKMKLTVSKENRLKTLFYVFFYQLLGLSLTLKLLERAERKSIGNYSRIFNDSEMSTEEAKGLRAILEDELRHEEEFQDFSTIHKFFINQVSMIFTQMSNGLATILAVSTGFSILYDDSSKVAVPILVVGVSSALSLGLIFYFFSLTQRTLRVDILHRIDVIIEIMPQAYLRRINKYMTRKNISEASARAIVEDATKNHEALRTIIAEEEYGIKTTFLGDPFKTFWTATLLRIGGTVLPLVPFFLLRTMLLAIGSSVVITLLLLAMSGFFVALSADVDIKKKIGEFTLSGMILVLLILLLGIVTTMIKEML